MNYKEKAKRYDEALKAAIVASKDEDRHLKATLERIFPELKESREDEMIRVIKEVILNSVPYKINILTKNTTITAEEAIAWLEKQGKPIDKIVERAMNEKQRVLLTETNGDANIDWDTRSLQDVKLLLKYGLDYIKKLEKQGEQKPYGQREECSDCEFRCGDKCIGSCAMKRGEQNLIDKIEPIVNKEKGYIVKSAGGFKWEFISELGLKAKKGEEL